MQNPALGIANGAIWCKLWPKTIFEPKPEDLACLLGTILEADWAMETYFFTKLCTLGGCLGGLCKYVLIWNGFRVPPDLKNLSFVCEGSQKSHI